MQYTVIIQPVQSGGFAASVPALPGCRSRGATEKEVLAKIRTAISSRLQHAKIVQVEVKSNGTSKTNAWERIVGMFEDDPIFGEVEREMKRHRKLSRPKRTRST